jgi:hypothetical protein
MRDLQTENAGISNVYTKRAIYPETSGPAVRCGQRSGRSAWTVRGPPSRRNPREYCAPIRPQTRLFWQAPTIECKEATSEEARQEHCREARR